MQHGLEPLNVSIDSEDSKVKGHTQQPKRSKWNQERKHHPSNKDSGVDLDTSVSRQNSVQNSAILYEGYQDNKDQGRDYDNYSDSDSLVQGDIDGESDYSERAYAHSRSSNNRNKSSRTPRGQGADSRSLQHQRDDKSQRSSQGHSNRNSRSNLEYESDDVDGRRSNSRRKSWDRQPAKRARRQYSSDLDYSENDDFQLEDFDLSYNNPSNRQQKSGRQSGSRVSQRYRDSFGRHESDDERSSALNKHRHYSGPEEGDYDGANSPRRIHSSYSRSESALNRPRKYSDREENQYDRSTSLHNPKGSHYKNESEDRQVKRSSSARSAGDSDYSYYTQSRIDRINRPSSYSDRDINRQASYSDQDDCSSLNEQGVIDCIHEAIANETVDDLEICDTKNSPSDTKNSLSDTKNSLSDTNNDVNDSVKGEKLQVPVVPDPEEDIKYLKSFLADIQPRSKVRQVKAIFI